MKKIISKVLPWVLFITFFIAAIIPPILAYASEYDLLYAPFASWFVFVLSGLILALDGIAFYSWHQFRKTRKYLAETSQKLIDLTKQPLEDEIPAVCGHKHLDEAEFLALIQILFRHPPGIEYIHVKPLPGGYGGSTTVLAKLQRKQSNKPLPRASVIKLGDKREMADEHTKFEGHVWKTLDGAPSHSKYAEWGDYAGIAYEFAGLETSHAIQSFYQFYQGHASVELTELIGEIYSRLDRAWYQSGQIEAANLYHEYNLLSKKRELIIGCVGEIVDKNDRYRDNFTALEERLQPHLKPDFCPAVDIRWRDPVAFLRTWPQQDLIIPIYRSVVHGDLHARNVLIEIGKRGQKHVWFIDFSHTGNGLSADRTREALREGIQINPNRGHTLRDFCRLEADVKFILTGLQNEDDLRLAVTFERELMAWRPALNDRPVIPPPIEDLMDERFKKAWQVIGEIRRQAAKYLTNADDLRPYYLSLLHATLPIVYYHPEQFENEACELQQKRYALISAGMLCKRL